MKKYLYLMRVHHYIKNILIFMPLIFSGNLTDRRKFTATLLVMIAFSLVTLRILVGTQINDSTNGMGSLIGDTFTVRGKADTNLGYNSLLYLMSDYLGFSPYYGTYEEIQNWMQREVVREMPSYPADGTIQVIDDTIIVKLSDYEIN